MLDVVQRDVPSSRLVHDHRRHKAIWPSLHKSDYKAYIASAPQDAIETDQKEYAHVCSDGCFGSSSSTTALHLTPDLVLSLVS